MGDGRVTDVVEYYKEREDLRNAVHVVRERTPERFRWRKAVASVVASAGTLDGKARMRIEEPVREVVVDLGDFSLRREVVLDARRLGVDLDRGEVLPARTIAEVQYAANAAGADLTLLNKYTPLNHDIGAQADTAGLILVSRALGEHFRARGNRLLLDLPEEAPGHERKLHHVIMMERAGVHKAHAQRWFAFARQLMGDE